MIHLGSLRGSGEKGNINVKILWVPQVRQGPSHGPWAMCHAEKLDILKFNIEESPQFL